MLVKRYHVKDMQEAMDTVIKELGPDAVILNSRRIRKKGLKNLFSKPLLEVMVAYDPAKIPMAKRAGSGFPGLLAASEKDGREASMPPGNPTAAQLQSLDKRIDSIDSLLTEFMDKFSYVKREVTYDYSEGVEEMLLKLIENQVREELAHALCKETDSILKRQPGTVSTEVMEHLLLEQLGDPEPIQHKKFNQKIILFIGPTGVGKTTSLVKLAANFSVKHKKKVGIINTDTYRIAAQEQLKAYADILGIPLGVIYQPFEISEAVEDMDDRDLIFIDTAGKKPGDEQHKDDILKYIELCRPEEVMLCVSASTSFASAKEIIDTYSFIDEYKLLVTKLDETKHRGIILNLSWYSQRPFSYVTTGQNVPDDIEEINMESIVSELLRKKS